ncbi:hypothetical protein HY450_00620 [Candidatus Pacearchaeota archaeon]|nr:hypothetical protein [Candidatus Pacearchaeota archaeon]
MELEKNECVHVSEVLRETTLAIVDRNAIKLRELSDKTIHSACSNQDSASLTIAVIIYALGKIIERGDFNKIKNWSTFVKKINLFLTIASESIKKEQYEKYSDNVEKARKVLTSLSVNLKPYIEDVLKKASINKASKLYEHGVSLERTAKLLGVSQWELAEYIGQKRAEGFERTKTIDVKKRARMAMEFFE